jgi:hypothetical protein
MDREERCAAKAQLVAPMQTGQSWQAAATSAGVQTSLIVPRQPTRT